MKQTELYRGRRWNSLHLINRGWFHVCYNQTTFFRLPGTLEAHYALEVHVGPHYRTGSTYDVSYCGVVTIDVGEDANTWDQTKRSKFVRLLRAMMEFVDAKIVHETRDGVVLYSALSQSAFNLGFSQLVTAAIKGRKPEELDLVARAMVSVLPLFEQGRDIERSGYDGPTWNDIINIWSSDEQESSDDTETTTNGSP